MPKVVPPVLILVIASAALAACGRSEVPPEPPPAAQPAPAQAEQDKPKDIEELIAQQPGSGSFNFEAYAYDCDGLEVTVRPGDGELMVILPDRSIVLPQVEAASGAKYADGDTAFWGKGINSAQLTLDGEDTPCQLDRRATPWVDARARGAHFRGVGQEPGWQIEMHEDRIVMVYQYGERRAVVPNPGVVTDPDQPVRRWQSTTEEHELQAIVEDRSCTDVMSGDTFPTTVKVTLDGREYLGCGRDLE
jgi:putative lipoprotein